MSFHLINDGNYCTHLLSKCKITAFVSFFCVLWLVDGIVTEWKGGCIILKEEPWDIQPVTQKRGSRGNRSWSWPMQQSCPECQNSPTVSCLSCFSLKVLEAKYLRYSKTLQLFQCTNSLSFIIYLFGCLFIKPWFPFRW